MATVIKSISFVLLVWLSPNSADAHEGRPVYVQLTEVFATETAEYQYRLQWKIPPVIAAGSEPAISLVAAACEDRSQRRFIAGQQKLSGIKIYHCDQVPSSLAVAIEYPQSNPALSSLLLFSDSKGNSQHLFSGPEQQLIQMPGEVSAFAVARQYIAGGTKHILLGWDHLLFVLCLMVLARSFTRILITVTGFTVAHTITLLLSALNLIAVPILFVETLIALSIVLLAAEILRPVNSTETSLSRRYPASVASCFGLLHGFGFASVLGELGLPQTMKVTALLFFNLGIELGQVLFICAVLVFAYLTGRFISTPLQRDKLVATGVYAIGVIATYLMFSRLALEI